MSVGKDDDDDNDNISKDININNINNKDGNCDEDVTSLALFHVKFDQLRGRNTTKVLQDCKTYYAL